MTMHFDALSRAELYYEVQDLLSRHVELIDDDRLEDWPALFTESCIYKVVPRENADRGMSLPTIYCDSRGMLTDRIVSLRRANIYPIHHYRHVVGGPRLTAIEPELVRAQTNYVVFQTRTSGETSVYNAGKYIDEIVSEGDELRFRSKVVVYDTNRIDTLMVRPI